ncbi:GPN-loop GTPase 2-like [Phymastichus coffea]|uniref:GPN-loop GTPase 2-like n=1 Tax=Phymastichus coffea TaxID=108790 RepID=UPI00273B917E|nr:GPN-loop GTPase 2-like [Phymastichus coffea]XP_058805360.1 GPN-loop GTPase 2-like [Phymastichus coffea]XP_058805361.1 GPN-loop GTPase 2-like [Phymastichus coffea]
MSTIFGQLVIGPPGSGKTTYCTEMGKFLESLGRKVAIINIDPANENMGYKPAVDVSELVKHEEVMKTLKLGPNGALVYCIEFLEKNIEWLIRKVLNFKNHYVLIDCPGQVELYTHHESMNKITEKLSTNLVRLCCVNLMDSHHCSDPGKYLSSLMVCTITMLQLGLPHVNVMTKLDDMKRFKDKLDFNIDFYTDVLNLDYLLERLNEDNVVPQYVKLNEALISLVQDYSLVTFVPLDISNKTLLLNVKNAVDKANGYIFGGNEPQDVQSLLACAVGAVSETERTASLETYM